MSINNGFTTVVKPHLNKVCEANGGARLSAPAGPACNPPTNAALFLEVQIPWREWSLPNEQWNSCFSTLSPVFPCKLLVECPVSTMFMVTALPAAQEAGRTVERYGDGLVSGGGDLMVGADAVMSLETCVAQLLGGAGTLGYLALGNRMQREETRSAPK